MSVNTLLQEFGLNEDAIKGITEENIGSAREAIFNSVKAKLLDDEEFYKGIDANKLPKDLLNNKFNEGVSKIAAMSKGAVDKHFGLTEADKETFSEEDKKDISKYIAKAASIFKEKSSGLSKDIAELQNENLQLKQQLEGRSKEIESLNEKFNSELTEKLTAKETETLAMIEASTLQENIPVPIGIIWDKVFPLIKNKYAVVIDAGVPSIRKKDNASFKVEKADKSGYLTLKDALTEELKGLGVWKDSSPAGGNTNHIRVDIQPNKSVPQKIQDKIAQEEKMFS